MVAPELARRTIALFTVALAAGLQWATVGDVAADREATEVHDRPDSLAAWNPLALLSSPGDAPETYRVRVLGSELAVPVPTDEKASPHLHPSVAEPQRFATTYSAAAATTASPPSTAPVEIAEEHSAPILRLVD